MRNVKTYMEEALYIRSDGTITRSIMFDHDVLAFRGGILDAGNGKGLWYYFDYEDEYPTHLKLVDLQTAEVEKTVPITSGADSVDGGRELLTNDDGTMILFCYADNKTKVLILDADLTVVKSLIIDGWVEFTPINNGGFTLTKRTASDNHGHNYYRVSRYDRYLNLMWETDVTCNFAYYFESAGGEIWSYKSMLFPDRECYIERYSSEERYRTEHTHSLTCVEEIPDTCMAEGLSGYWRCTDCGVWYSDADGTNIMVEREVLPVTDHSFTNYVSDGNATAEAEGTKTAYCDYGCQATHTVADRVEEPDQTPDNSGAVVVIVAVLCAMGVAAAVVGVVVWRKKIKK